MPATVTRRRGAAARRISRRALAVAAIVGAWGVSDGGTSGSVRAGPQDGSGGPRVVDARRAAAGLLGLGVAGADESRFLPWKEGATPGLELRDLSGRPVTLADFRGQVVLVNFWATWCEFCKDEMASMTTLHEQLAGQPVAVVAVNFGESSSRVRDYAKRIPPHVRVLLDPDQDASRAWRVRVIPSSFLVDRAGRVQHRVIGNLDWASEESIRTIRALLR